MLTSYCGGQSGRFKGFSQNSAKVAIAGLNKAAIRVTRGAISLSSSNYLPACVASATAKPVALPPGRLSPDKKLAGLVITVQEFSTMRPAPGRPHRRAIAWA
jgi:hypothetical protein